MVLLSTVGKSERRKSRNRPPCCWQRPSCHGQCINSTSTNVSWLLPSTHSSSVILPFSLSLPYSLLTFPFIYWSFGFSPSPFESNRRDSDRRPEERDPKIKHIQGLSMAPVTLHQTIPIVKNKHEDHFKCTL